MKVKELIDTLKEFDPEDLIITAVDEEGNGYRSVDYVTPYYVETTDSGDLPWNIEEVYLRELPEGEEGEKYTMEDCGYYVTGEDVDGNMIYDERVTGVNVVCLG